MGVLLWNDPLLPKLETLPTYNYDMTEGKKTKEDVIRDRFTYNYGMTKKHTTKMLRKTKAGQLSKGRLSHACGRTTME